MEYGSHRGSFEQNVKGHVIHFRLASHFEAKKRECVVGIDPTLSVSLNWLLSPTPSRHDKILIILNMYKQNRAKNHCKTRPKTVNIHPLRFYPSPLPSRSASGIRSHASCMSVRRAIHRATQFVNRMWVPIRTKLKFRSEKKTGHSRDRSGGL